jgi:DNA polymerase III sliding clamp (beta) subunit (PCNA family)
MKINKNYKPELCSSLDSEKPHLRNLWLDVEKKRLFATDGKRLVVIVVEINSEDKSGPITARALKEAREVQENSVRAKDDMPSIHATEKDLIVGDTKFKRPTDNGFPFTSIETILADVDKREQTVKIGINARLLYEAAMALGAEKIVLSVDSKDSTAPMKITSLSSHDENLVMLMPVRIK